MKNFVLILGFVGVFVIAIIKPIIAYMANEPYTSSQMMDAVWSSIVIMAAMLWARNAIKKEEDMKDE